MIFTCLFSTPLGWGGPSPAWAGLVTIRVSEFVAGEADPGDLEAVFEDVTEGSESYVLLTLSAKPLVSGWIQGNENSAGWAFNVRGGVDLSGLVFTYVSGPYAEVALGNPGGLGKGLLGEFDWFVYWPNRKDGSFNKYLDPQGVTSFKIAGEVDAMDFFTANEKGFLSAAHVQGLEKGSAKIAAVPIPGTTWLLGSGVAVLWGIRRRRFRKA